MEKEISKSRRKVKREKKNETRKTESRSRALQMKSSDTITRLIQN